MLEQGRFRPFGKDHDFLGPGLESSFSGEANDVVERDARRPGIDPFGRRPGIS